MPRKTPLVDKVDAQMLGDAEARIRTNKMLPFARITSVKLTPAARDELVKQLVLRGLERTPKLLRVPLAAQIESLVKHGARVARKDLGKRIKGATKTEVETTLAKLMREKRVHLVVRTQTEIIVGPDEQVLGLTEMHQLTKAIALLAKTVKKVQAKGLPKTLLREDLEAVMGSSVPKPKPTLPNVDAINVVDVVDMVDVVDVEQAKQAETLVVETLRQLEEPNIKLVRIADLVRRLAPRLPKNEVHRVLSKAFELGSIELRPDGGTEFLKPEDTVLCIPGPRGTVFSYARRMSDDR